MKRTVSIFVAVVFLITLFVSPIASSAADELTNEAIELRTEFEKHFNNYDGTMTAYVSPIPLHYNNNGEWVEIDNTLIEDANGNYVNADNPMRVTLSSIEHLRKEQNEMVSISYNGYNIGWNLLNEGLADDAYLDFDGKSIADYMGIQQLDNKIRRQILSKISSHVTYKSILPNTDIDVELSSDYVKESIILTSQSGTPTSFSYFMDADGLLATLNEDGSICFQDEDQIVFTIPAPFMFDQSEDAEMNYNICVELEQMNDGYLIQYIPDAEWLASASTVYPVVIDPQTCFSRTSCGISFSYNSQANPNSVYNGSYIYVGNETGNGYQGFGTYSGDLTTYGHYQTITYASLCISAYSKNSYDSTINTFANMEQLSSKTWANASSSSVTHLNSFNIDQGNFYHSYFVVDMTNLLQAWLNYVNAGASSGVGQQNFGFKWTNASPTTAAIYTGTSLTALSYYLNITYRISSAYKMYYEPQKYNRINSTIGNGSIYNFQYRMNCYGYALQVYYNGTLPTAEENAYRQRPGEFGIQYPYSSYYTTNYLDLKNYYDGFSTSFDNQTTDSGRYTVCMTYLQFIQEQMYADAASMGFTVTPYYFSGDTFNIDPASGYNANTERIIALTVYKYHRYNQFSGNYIDILDYHFYVRGNDDDGSNGKKWTSKPGTEVITDKCLQSAYSNVTLNDSNINTYACYFNYCSYTPNVVRYYRITQNTDVYSHWNGYGHDNNSTGTPYCQ